MAFENPIKFTIKDNVDYLLDEKNNTFIALRKIAWGDTEEGKMDIRRWYNNDEGEDTPGKGVTLSNDACDELTLALLKENYGETEDVLTILKERKNFKSALNKLDDIKEELYDDGLEVIDLDSEDEEDLYDPEAILD